jgi:hypothetical protein
MIGVSEAYIAFFEAQICDIGTRSIPKLVTSQHLTNPSPQNFRTKTFFDFLQELLTARPPKSPFYAATCLICL